MKKSLLFIMIVTAFFGCKPKENSNEMEQTDNQIEALLASLSLEEKAGQLNLIPIEGDPKEEHLQMIRDGKVGGVLKANGVKMIRQLQKIAVEESKSGIPILFQEDVIHGFKTIAPIPIAEASSWDLEAIRKSASVSAREASASGVLLTYAPMLDVTRDPRWGRILETSGEDPYLASMVGVARVKGFQESNPSGQNILSCGKHYVGYGSSLAGRDYNIQDISERELREVHLPPFQSAIDVGVASLMCAYTACDGVPMSSNEKLMKTLLRENMGFKGATMTDWQTISNLVKIGVAENDTIATAMTMDAGLDIDMSSEKYVNLIPHLVRSGQIAESQVDNAVRNVLMLKKKAGLLNDPLALLDEGNEKKELLSERNINEVKAMTLKSMVLLKNDNNFLPLSTKSKNIAVIGPFAKDNENMLGWWHCHGDPKDVTNYFDGITSEFKESKITYAKGCDVDGFDSKGEDLIPEAVKIAKSSDVVILVLGEALWMSGEGGGVASLDLPGVQQKLMDALAETGVPIVTVINAGRPYILTPIAEKSTALIYAWMPGTTGGSALAEILSGAFNPQAKLPVTFPYHQGQIPIFYNYKRTSHPFIEGITKNRYTTTYRDMQNEPLYPFGYGLSYTTFDYSEIDLSTNEMTISDTLTASIKITNSGKVKGTEIVQMYIGDEVCSVTRPVKELKGFNLVELEPGETKAVSFKITSDKLSFINKDKKSTIEKGAFSIYIGKNSVDLKKAKFKLK